MIKQNVRATGEEQGEAHQGTLPMEFRVRFPSLLDVYGKLSAAMHFLRHPDAAQIFDDSVSKIIEHFDARRVFKFS